MRAHRLLCAWRPLAVLAVLAALLPAMLAQAQPKPPPSTFGQGVGNAVLWGAPVTDVIVSDDTSPLVFMGVVADATPEKLEPAIRAASGLRFDKLDYSAYPVRGSVPGSKIVYFRTKAKVYCAKYKPLPPAQTR